MQIEKNNTVDREQRSSLILGTAFELVWDVWTNPGHIKEIKR